MNRIDASLRSISDAVLRARDQDGIWELGREEFYRLSQTTFGLRVLMWQGGRHRKETEQSLKWLQTALVSNKTLHYTRTLAWPLYLFADADPAMWRTTSAFLAERLLELQNQNGSWGHGTNPPSPPGSGMAHPFPTALAVLALSRGFVPQASHMKVSASIRHGVAWLRSWIETPCVSQPASASLALTAVHSANTHDVSPSELQGHVARLIGSVQRGKKLEPEVIPGAARRLDAPYMLMSSAWLAFLLSQLGDLSAFRTHLSLIQDMLALVQKDGRVGLTATDPSPQVYCAFNVYLALRSFKAKYMNDTLINELVSERRAMETVALGPKKPRVRVFVGSSVEGLAVARSVQSKYEYDGFDTVVWEDGVIRPSATTIESLQDATATFDFAIMVLTPDDLEASRGEIQPSIRDNVVFELGLFIGALGRGRVFMLHPRSPFKKPSDLLGITMVSYEPARFGADPAAALGTACSAIRSEILKLGPRP